MMIKELMLKEEFCSQVISLEQAYFKHDALQANQLEDIVQSEDHAVFIYCEDDEILGYIYVNVIASERLINIMKLGVNSEYRRQGIAIKLITHVENWVRAMDMDTLILEVRTSNMSAIELYKKCRYEVIGSRKNFYEFPLEDGLILTKKLKKKNDV